MAKPRQPGDMFRAFQAKKQKAANPNSPANYGPAMQRAFGATKTFGMPTANSAPLRGGTRVGGKLQTSMPYRNPNVALQTPGTMGGIAKKKKASSVLAPINRGRKAQEAYAKKFGTVPVSKKKRKASKLDMEMAFKKKGGVKKKSASR